MPVPAETDPVDAFARLRACPLRSFYFVNTISAVRSEVYFVYLLIVYGVNYMKSRTERMKHVPERSSRA